MVYGIFNKPIEINGDGLEYIYVAQSLLNGDGFISNENNIYERPYLGNNNYFSDSPIYPMLIVPFLYVFENDVIIIIATNLLFHFLLVVLFFKTCTFLKINKYLIIIGMLALIFNSSLNFYGIVFQQSNECHIAEGTPGHVCHCLKCAYYYLIS